MRNLLYGQELLEILPANPADALIYLVPHASLAVSFLKKRS
ncbi:MAG: hypothetical protein AB1767_13535 [Bacillota bacterium]